MIKRVWVCMKEDPLKHAVSVLAGGLAGALLIGIYFMPPSDSGQLAGWVQAIGAVGAIGIAIWLASYSERKRVSLELQDRKNKEKLVIMLLSTTVSSLQAVVNSLGSGGASADADSYFTFMYAVSRYKKNLDILEAIPLFDVSFMDVLLKTVGVRSILAGADMYLYKFNNVKSISAEECISLSIYLTHQLTSAYRELDLIR